MGKRNAKVLLIALLMISLVGTVSASFPQYTVTELLEDEVINGDNDLGDLLFLGQQYTAQNYIKGTITPLTLQQYDVMNWIGTSTVRIKNPQNQEMIITNGSSYYFPYAGDYIMTSMLNASVFATITATPAEDNNISVTKVSLPTGFALSINPSQFTLDDEEIVRFSLDIDDDVEFGDYTIKYAINGDERTKRVEVLENNNWSMDISNLTESSTIRSGEGKYLGRIVLENEGNTDIEITVDKDGDGKTLVGTPQPQTLYRKNNIYIDIQAQVPTVVESGTYKVNLTISGGDIEKYVGFNITVVDNIKPVIEQINFSSSNVYVVNDIAVVASDNVDVTNVTMKYDNVVKELLKDENLFTTQVKFTKLSRYVIEFCAYDNDDNVQCTTVNRTFDKVEVIENATTIYNMPSVRYGKYSKIRLFDINQRVNEGIVFTLIDMQTSQVGDNNTQPIVRIVDAAGSIKQFSSYGDITVFTPGTYYLEVRADREMDVDGVIRVEMPEQYKEIADFTFKSSFKTYDVPQDFSVEWVDGRDVTCKVKDTGDLDSSYYDCSMRYPISTKASDISIPTTVEERTKLKNEALDVQEELDRNKRRSGWFITLLIGAFISLMLFTLFFIYWYPYVRFKTGSKKNIKIKEGEGEI